MNIRAGEIVGFSGLMGAGRAGSRASPVRLGPLSDGEVRINGNTVKISTVQNSIDLGMAMLSEDRKRYGIIPIRSIRENVGLSSSRSSSARAISTRRSNGFIASVCDRMLRVKASSMETAVVALSGGNQQKVVFAKWVLRTPTS